jgi:MoaA/NifB/PqqE/SkfB family radical SAM enzyme
MKCLAPWKAISVRFNGDITPDCVYTGRNGNIHEDSLPSLLQHPGLLSTQTSIEKGILPKQCIQCEKKESINNHSRRIFFDQILSHVPRTPTNDIRFLEVNISNKCNLKCVMCSGVNSTAWIKEDIKLHELGIERPINHPDFGYRIISNDIIDRLFEYPSYLKNLEYVNIKGGEPFMEESNIKLLNKLIELNLNKQVTIDLSTNGTTENPEFEELLTQFKTKIHISVEATGKLYEYIRGGQNYTWEQFLSNLPRFNKFDRVILAGTVMTYNVRHFGETMKYFIMNYPKYDMYFNNTVTTPEYLNPTLLPKDILHGTGFWHDITLADQLPVFVEYTKRLDEIRGTNILDVCPEFDFIFA